MEAVKIVCRIKSMAHRNKVDLQVRCAFFKNTLQIFWACWLLNLCMKQASGVSNEIEN